jgi:hypothetical protein
MGFENNRAHFLGICNQQFLALRFLSKAELVSLDIMKSALSTGLGGT